MASYVIDATGFGAYYEYVGGDGDDDTVTINIGVGFSGSITVDSLQSDGGIETVDVNIPDGWTLQLTSENALPGEDPPMVDYSYSVIDANGNSVGTMSIRANIVNVPCFCQRTSLIGENGRTIRIEEICEGDLVQAIDGKLHSVRWIGVKTLSKTILQAEERLRPIKISAGALGPAVPSDDLLVSPQHRILVKSKIVERMFGVQQVLVAAKKLLDLEGVEIVRDFREVTYYHILFDQHEIIVANGAAAESLYLGPQAQKSLSPASLREIEDIFPEIGELNRTSTFEAAALIPSGKKARRLIKRHVENSVPIYSKSLKC